MARTTNCTRYRTFFRACTDWESFVTARKRRDKGGMTAEEARARCKSFNDGRTADQIRNGLKMEFEAES